MTVEIAVQDVQGARVACDEGADRIELCVALGATGGLTPSYALIERCAAVGLPQGVQALVRPRGGSFVFDDDEKLVQLDDVRAAIRAGAAGVVVGGLLSDGSLDLPFAEDLAKVAHAAGEECGRRVQVTFHRAFDVAADRHAALDSLVDLGYTRILTSGGAPTVPQGLEALGDLVAYAEGRIEIQAGGGLKPEGIADAWAVGVRAMHLSAKHLVASDGGPGGGGDDACIERTDVSTVRAAVAAERACRA